MTTLLNGVLLAAALSGQPWAIRYIVVIEPGNDFKVEADYAAKLNARVNANNAGVRSLDGMALLQPTSVLSTQGNRTVAIAAFEFARDGHVLAPKHLNNFVAKRTSFNAISLVPKSEHKTQYTIAWWAQGVPGDIYFSPAVCDILDDLRYGDNWTKGFEEFGDVGCREWTAQLYQRDRPYIDTTTYTDDGNFVGRVVGWSRFRDPPKPVIGQHGATWLCLYECPAGERPGVIPDIRAWTARHGFPLPHRPKEQPEFPNQNYRDDFNE